METKNVVQHLIICQHGLHGSPNDFNNFIKLWETEGLLLKPFVVLHTVKDLVSLTRDGIVKGGQILLKELEKLQEAYALPPNRLKLSFFGHSLGGLYARYAIGKLYKKGLFDTLYEPYWYVSYATPHCGSRRPNGGIVSAVATNVCKYGLSSTGLELLLEERVENPLLLKMADPCKCYFQGLKLFKRRICYSNIKNDISVLYCTSALDYRNPYLRERDLCFELRYPHVIKTLVSHENDFPTPEELGYGPHASYLRFILDHLKSLEWESYAVCFQTFLAHEQIIWKKGWLAGDDVVRHTLHLFMNELGLYEEQKEVDVQDRVLPSNWNKVFRWLQSSKEKSHPLS